MVGRSKTGSRRSAIVHLRLSLEENAALMVVCATRKLTVSEGLRRLARDAGGLGPTLEGAERQVIEALTDQMTAIGHSLDQAVRAINVGRLPEGGALRDALTGLSQVLREAHGLYAGLCRKAQARHAGMALGAPAAAAPSDAGAGA
jgi:Excreted virulence factor EspC, type VII ESX diderm